jgi:hypothetical protein
MNKAGDKLKERPKPTLKMTSFDPKRDKWIPSYGKNCCYLVQHRHAFNTVWQEKHTTEKEEAGNSDGIDIDMI